MLYTPLSCLFTILAHVGVSPGVLAMANPSTHVIHATHPSISYFPRTTRFGGNTLFNPWDLRDYEEDTGEKRSFLFIRNGRRNTQEDSAREVHFTVKGTSLPR